MSTQRLPIVASWHRALSNPAVSVTNAQNYFGIAQDGKAVLPCRSAGAKERRRRHRRKAFQEREESDKETRWERDQARHLQESPSSREARPAMSTGGTKVLRLPSLPPPKDWWQENPGAEAVMKTAPGILSRPTKLEGSFLGRPAAGERIRRGKDLPSIARIHLSKVTVFKQNGLRSGRFCVQSHAAAGI